MFAALMLVSLQVMAPAPAPGVHRIALTIGANTGNALEQRLQYAVTDAQHMADVLVELGGFKRTDVLVLADPTPTKVRETFNTLREGLAQEGGDAMLFVYYSGHADALTVHLGGSNMLWDEVLRLTNGSGAATRLLVVDACRSGQVTRVKGSRVVAPFSIAQVGLELPKGFAVLASASADEAAQESDEVGGSLFTQHFISALRGAGDINHDGRVSLIEAFQYSSDRTLASSASSLAGVQHATFRYHLRGHADLSLTDPGFNRDVTHVALKDPGEYFVRSKDASGALVASVVARAGMGDNDLWLPAGRYFIQRRTPAQLYEGYLELLAGKPATVDSTQLHATALQTLASKGSVAHVSVDALVDLPEPPVLRPDTLSLWGGAGGPAIAGFSVPWRVGAQYNRELSPLWVLDAGTEFGQSSVRNKTLTTHLRDVSLFGGLRAQLHVQTNLTLSLGARAGAVYLSQSYSGSPEVDPTRRLAPFAAAVAGVQYDLSESFFIGFEANLRAFAVTLQSGSQVTVQPVGTLGVGLKL